MDSFALLIAATLNAGTVLAIAGLGLLINERAGIVNLGAEGMMLVAAIAGFATCVHTGNDWVAFGAGAVAGALMAAVFGILVIYLNTNQYASGLALSLFGVGFSAFVGIRYTQEKLPERPQFDWPLLGDIPFVGPALFKQHPMVYLAIALTIGAGVVPVPLACRVGAARGRRVAGVGARARLSGAPHPHGRGDDRRRAVRRGRRVPVGDLHAVVGRRHGGGQGLDRARVDDVRDLAAGARAARRVSVRWRDDVAVPPARPGRRRAEPVPDDAAVRRNDRRAGADLAQRDVDPVNMPASLGKPFFPGG